MLYNVHKGHIRCIRVQARLWLIQICSQEPRGTFTTTVFSLIYQTLVEASTLSSMAILADAQAIAQHSSASHLISGRAGLSLRFCRNTSLQL